MQKKKVLTGSVTRLFDLLSLLYFSLFPPSQMAKRGRKGKKEPPRDSVSTSTSSSNSLRLILPARCNITLNSPTQAVASDMAVIQPDLEPVTPAPPVPQPLPVEPETLLHSHNVEQEILDVLHSEPLPAATKLMDNFFTLEDSQGEDEISPPPTQKPKQSKKSVSAQAKAEIDEKAQRESYNFIVDVRYDKNDFDRCRFADSPVVWCVR